VSILTATFDEDVAKRVWQEEAREEGMEKGLEEGMEKGLKKGLEKGRKEERTSFAKKLLAYKEPLEKIIDLTGLTSAEINKIIAKG